METVLQQLIDYQRITDLIQDYCTYLDLYGTAHGATPPVEDCVTDFGPSFGARRASATRPRGDIEHC